MRTLLFAAIMIRFASQVAAVQDVTVRGVVVDRSTGVGVAGASIEVLPRKAAAITDTTGHFALPRLTEGPVELLVRRLGYEGALLSYDAELDMPLLRIEITPNPVMMQAIEVVADRFKSRRQSAARMLKTYTGEQLLTVPGIDIYDVVRSGAFIARCPATSGFQKSQGGSSVGVGDTCVQIRGRWIVPTICVDGLLWYGDLESLRGWNKSEIYRLEIVQRGSAIEVFTFRFMDRLARGKVRVPQNIPSCARGFMDTF